MTGVEIGIALLSAAFYVLIIAMTLVCGAHDREIDELRHRVTMLEKVTMLEMQRKDGEAHENH